MPFPVALRGLGDNDWELCAVLVGSQEDQRVNVNNTALVGLDYILDIIHPDGRIAHCVK